MFFRRSCFTLLSVGLWISPLGAAGPMLKKDPEVPPLLTFNRALDLEGYAGQTNRESHGEQAFLIRTRYLDPEASAFVGLMTTINHFNQDLRLGSPDAPDTAGLLANWGADIGVVRGKHLWEVDLMGANASRRLGFAGGLVGEHTLGRQFILYHRTVLNLFTNDQILDADQGLYWMIKPQAGIMLGYRWVTSQHMDRSGPHVGLRFYFESPKIPFIFPSIG